MECLANKIGYVSLTPECLKVAKQVKQVKQVDRIPHEPLLRALASRASVPTPHTL